MFEVRRTAVFAKWFANLKDAHARARVQIRIDRVELGNFGDAEFFNGMGELRIDYGPGYRLYFVKRGNEVRDFALRRRQEYAAAEYQAGHRHDTGVGLVPLETLKWDAAEYLDNEEAIFAYVEAAFEDGDPAVITHALGNIARARGMTSIARQAGVTREALYKALSQTGDPKLTTLLGVMRALGVKLTATKTVDDPTESRLAG